MTQPENQTNELVNQILFVIPFMPKKLFGNPQSLSNHDLHPTHFHILYIIECHHSLSMGDIAEKLAVKKSNLTPLIQKLSKKKLITQMKSEQDRRKTYIELSEEGKTFLEDQKQFLQLRVKERLSELNTEEQLKLQESLSTLGELLSKIKDE
ncbi:MarR family winged helix-turn-helix transcriptional regulator [Alkalibacillus aidingensis]|uniref:MarR family winged helix-turn-helix transcriptional regulator n=1 Tax=Alkalibacillus aidingensis TaxID=2747607 RepID=UPI001661766A|nr:MarR family transcriptional regulator [Alkalibacillus aidingensis]